MAVVDLPIAVATLDAKIKSLSADFDRVESLLFAATVLLVVGLIIEYWDDVRELRAAIREKRSGLLSALRISPIWHHARTLIGGVLVIGGVSWELVEEIQAARIDSELRSANAGEINLLTSAAKNSMGLIAQANADARNAEEKTEAERLQRVKIEAQIAPRRLSPDDKVAISAALKPFANKTVLVESYALDGDGAAFATQLIDVLKAARIAPVDGRMSQSGLGAIAFGIHISGKDEQLGTAIGEALNAVLKGGVILESKPVQLGAGLSTGLPPAAAKADETVFVGIKPLPQ